MKTKHRTVRLAAVLLVLFTALVTPVQVCLAGENVPVTVEIPVRFAIEGASASICLSADDPEAPMPAGSRSGRKELTVRGCGETTFGEISYERPDVYHYTVRQIAACGACRDESVYHVRVIAESSGEGTLVITKEGREGKCEIAFGAASSALRGTSPATGDPVDPARACGMLLLAAAGAASILRRSGAK